MKQKTGEPSDNMVFANYGRTVGADDAYFMWGLPFFYGRSVYVGIDGASTPIGTGPFWAF